MTRCDHCGRECVLPFTCQHCGGKFCPDCRLPPGHDCTGMAGWKAKPAPATGVRYGRGGGVTATGGGPAGNRTPERKTTAAGGFPYLKLMIVIIVLILLGIAWLVLNGGR